MLVQSPRKVKEEFAKQFLRPGVSSTPTLKVLIVNAFSIPGPGEKLFKEFDDAIREVFMAHQDDYIKHIEFLMRNRNELADFIADNDDKPSHKVSLNTFDDVSMVFVFGDDMKHELFSPAILPVYNLIRRCYLSNKVCFGCGLGMQLIAVVSALEGLKGTQDLEFRNQLQSVVRRRPAHTMPMDGNPTEVCCLRSVGFQSHFLFNEVHEMKFQVGSYHEKCVSRLHEEVAVMASSLDEGPQIIEVDECVGLLFPLTKKQPRTIRMVENFILAKLKTLGNMKEKIRKRKAAVSGKIRAVKSIKDQLEEAAASSKEAGDIVPDDHSIAESRSLASRSGFDTRSVRSAKSSRSVRSARSARSGKTATSKSAVTGTAGQDSASEDDDDPQTEVTLPSACDRGKRTMSLLSARQSPNPRRASDFSAAQLEVMGLDTVLMANVDVTDYDKERNRRMEAEQFASPRVIKKMTFRGKRDETKITPSAVVFAKLAAGRELGIGEKSTLFKKIADKSTSHVIKASKKMGLVSPQKSPRTPAASVLDETNGEPKSEVYDKDSVRVFLHPSYKRSLDQNRRVLEASMRRAGVFPEAVKDHVIRVKAPKRTPKCNYQKYAEMDRKEEHTYQSVRLSGPFQDPYEMKKEEIRTSKNKFVSDQPFMLVPTTASEAKRLGKFENYVRKDGPHLGKGWFPLRTPKKEQWLEGAWTQSGWQSLREGNVLKRLLGDNARFAAAWPDLSQLQSLKISK